MSFGFVKQIWNNSDLDPDMSEQIKKQAILDSLYHHCQIRTHTSKDVYAKLLNDLKLVPPTNVTDKVLDVIREYKNTGKNLEATIDSLYSILYVTNTTTSNNGWSPTDT